MTRNGHIVTYSNNSNVLFGGMVRRGRNVRYNKHLH